MRLIDLDQDIFVPIVDESQGGCRYELRMTVGEFFDRFLEGSFTPEVVDAIPVDWLMEHSNEYIEEWGYEPLSVTYAVNLWQQEQEAQHDRDTRQQDL